MGCFDMMCGATDCTTCYGPCAGERDQPDPRTETKRPWLLDSGYEYDEPTNEWEIQVSCKRRTCRRDHADGRVKAGDVYLETTWRTVCDETGKSYHSRTRWVSQRASEEG